VVVQTGLLDRTFVKRRIEAVHDDISFIKSEIAKIKGRKAPPKRSQAKPDGRGRPPSLERLKAELRELEGARAYLHAEWVKLRGEPIFSGGAAQLEKLELIAGPAKPVKPKRGRPSRYVIGPAIRFWTDLVLARDRRLGKKNSVLKAGLEVQEIIQERHRKGFNFHEQDYYAEKRRIGKLRPTVKTRAK